MAYKRQMLLILVVVILFLSTPLVDALSVITSQPLSHTSIVEPEASLSGYVTDMSMNPISGALIRVYFHGTYKENYSNSAGYYHVMHIPLCYCLKNATCSKPGYQTQRVLLSISENTTHDFILPSLNQSCYPVFNGTMGMNGWYVSCVNISFIMNGDIDAVFYKVDGSLWTQYTTTFEVCESGHHILKWYWTFEGNESAVLSTFFNIDRDYPELNIFSERVSINKIKIIAVASDKTSSINRVEFFVDGTLWYIDSTSPYEGFILGIGTHHVNVVAFDNAGNSINQTIITCPRLQSHSHTFLSFLARIFFLCQSMRPV